MLAASILLFVVIIAVVAYTNRSQSVPVAEDPVGEELLGGDKDEYGCIGSAGYTWCEAKQTCLRTWETPCVSDDQIDEIAIVSSQIQEALVEKHGASAQNLDISVAEIDGDYARGGASEEGLGGGMWFAAKVDNTWELVWDGNGTIECESISPYPDFPSRMISECYDQQTGVVKQR